ncbi:hypothetical protein C8R43DRAFT_993510 [Mycena crocata]|nr:hypothetical protein C8R43DRAFT_993510 [Mycena crocata]
MSSITAIRTSSESAASRSSSAGQRASSRAPKSSPVSSSRIAGLSSSVSPTTHSTAPSPSLSSLPSLPTTPSPSSSVQRASTNAQTTALAHRPALIAAISAAVVLLILCIFGFLLYRRRCMRRSTRHTGSIGSTAQGRALIAHEAEDVYDDKGWRDSARSAAGSTRSGWPLQLDDGVPSAASTYAIPVPIPVLNSAPAPAPTPRPIGIDRRQTRTASVSSRLSLRAPHYTVRAHASVGDVYGFGQDVAWQQAHYEDALPTPSRAQPDIDVLPPTPHSDSASANNMVIQHDITNAPLLRNASTASTVPSVYSTASMEQEEDLERIPEQPEHLPTTSASSTVAGAGFPDSDPDRPLSMQDERNWRAQHSSLAGRLP